MTFEKAYECLMKYNGKLIVGAAAVYKGKAFLFKATEKGRENEIDPYYIVDSKTGKVYTYSPSGDYESFWDAISNHRIDLSSLKKSK